MDAARFNSDPKFRGVLFRRTYKQIQNPGGLLDEARSLYPRLGGEWIASRQSWEWKCGATLQLNHLQHEDTVQDWQGAQLAFIGFDELTHFTEQQFWYLASRKRSMSTVVPYVRAGCNPAPGWVREFLAPWVQKRYSGPGGPAKSGEIRWFVRRAGVVVWLVDGEETREGEEPKSVTFIRSSVYDNKKLLAHNPEYLGELKSLPDIDRRRLLDGDWDVFEGAFFDEWAEHRHAVAPPFQPGQKLPEHWRFFGGFDWGYRAPCAGVLGAVDELGCLHIIESFKAAGLSNEAQADKLLGLCAKWGIDPKRVLWGADPSMWNQKTFNALKAEADVEAFHRAGLVIAPADNKRRGRRGERGGWSPIRQLLHAPNAADGYSSALRVWHGFNAELIRQFPLMQFAKDGEDMETKGDDHLFDALRYLEATRPAGELTPEMLAQKRQAELEAAYEKHARERYIPKADREDDEPTDY